MKSNVTKLAVVIWLLSLVLAALISSAFAGESVMVNADGSKDVIPVGTNVYYIKTLPEMPDFEWEPSVPKWKAKDDTMIREYEYALSSVKTKRIRGRRAVGLGSDLL